MPHRALSRLRAAPLWPQAEAPMDQRAQARVRSRIPPERCRRVAIVRIGSSAPPWPQRRGDRPRRANASPGPVQRIVGPQTASCARLLRTNEMLLVIDDCDRTWDAALSGNEPLPLQHLDHLVRGRGRYEEVPCDI